MLFNIAPILIGCRACSISRCSMREETNQKHCKFSAFVTRKVFLISKIRVIFPYFMLQINGSVHDLACSIELRLFSSDERVYVF